ncbi:GNAT family N-acetyltransferase [Agarivorans gilvus]|jgi:GNAT superfamily N-acetyltransferase|nr:GNAT family N-acetyltransferase [Agarivorans gilvus]
MMSIHLRKATSSDAAAISQLILSLTEKYVCPSFAESARHILLTSMSAENVGAYLSGNYFYIVAATADEDIVGVAGIRDYSHLYHLFVDDSYQGQGLSRRLWEAVKAEALTNGNPGRFTVNSAVNAEHVYEHFGFQRIDGIRQQNGIIDVPMVLEIAS